MHAYDRDCRFLRGACGRSCDGCHFPESAPRRCHVRRRLYPILPATKSGLGARQSSQVTAAASVMGRRSARAPVTGAVTASCRSAPPDMEPHKPPCCRPQRLDKTAAINILTSGHVQLCAFFHWTGTSGGRSDLCEFELQLAAAAPLSCGAGVVDCCRALPDLDSHIPRDCGTNMRLYLYSPP